MQEPSIQCEDLHNSIPKATFTPQPSNNSNPTNSNVTQFTVSLPPPIESISYDPSNFASNNSEHNKSELHHIPISSPENKSIASATESILNSQLPAKEESNLTQNTIQASVEQTITEVQKENTATKIIELSAANSEPILAENKIKSYDDIPISMKSKQSFDEFPVGSLKVTQLSEFPTEEKPIEEEKGTLDERLVSKAWNTRAKAFEELAKQIPTMDAAALEAHSKKWTKYINDTNAASQEKAIDALKVYIEKYEAISEGMVENLASALIEKGMTSMKTTTKSKSVECLLALVEYSSLFEVVTKVIIDMLGKAVKIQIVAAQFTVIYLTNFGIAHVEVKGLIKCIEKLAMSTNVMLRNEAMNFYKELYKWIRDSLIPLLSNLKQAQQDELKKMFEEIKDSPIPIRLTKKEIAEGKKVEMFTSTIADKATKVDPFDLQEAQDILSKYNEAWCTRFGKLKTWKEKKETLDEVLKTVSIPKIKCPPLQCFIVTVEKIIDKESNIVVISSTIKILTAIASGLRKQLTGWKGLFPRLIYKCKEKKLEAEIMKCLEEMSWAINLTDIADEIKELTMSEKAKQVNPISKRCLSDWLGYYFKKFTTEQEIAKQLAKYLLFLSDDSSNEVRDSSLTTLGILKAKSHIDSILTDLNAQKKEKIEKSYSVCMGGDNEQNPTKNKEKATGEANKEETRTEIEPKKEDKRKANRNTEIKDEGNDDEEAEQGDIEKAVASKVSQAVIALLNSTAWKEKKEGFTQLTQLLNADATSFKPIQEPVVKYLKKILKAWKESNLNILKEAFAFFSAFQTSISISKKASFHLVGLYIEKISDAKFTALCDEGILKIAESAGPMYVTNRILKLADSLKLPAQIKGVINVLNHMLVEFSVKLFPLKPIIEYAKCGLLGNPAVKAASTEIIKTIYSNLGESMKVFISDLKEPQLKPLEAELSQIQIIKGETLKKRALVGEASEEESKSTISTIDSLIPRIDISAQITSKLIKLMSDSQWKTRNTALNEIKNILTKANNRIMPNGLNELLKEVGSRIKDSHKGVQRGYIQFIATIAEAIGPKVRMYSKFILPNLIDTLSDKQQLLRQDTLLSLSKFAEVAGVDIVVNHMAPMLMKDSPEMRIEILKWVLKDKTCLKTCDHKLLLPSIIAAMQDKSKDIRVMVEQTIPCLMPIVGMPAFIVAMQDLKQAVKNTIKPIIEKYNMEEAATGNQESNTVITMTISPPASVDYVTQDDINMSTELKTRTRNENKTALQTGEFSQDVVSDPRPKTSLANKTMKPIEKLENKPKDNVAPTKKDERKSTKPTKIVPSPSNPSLSDVGKVNTSSMTEINKMMPFVIASSKDKDKRAEFDRKHPWSSDEIRDDYVEWMKKVLKPVLNPNVFNAMFTTSNFKKHTDCVIALKVALKTEINEIVEILDLILKWICCRLIDNNPGLNKAIIVLLNELIVNLESISYTLYDSEASIIMPLLTERTGNSNQFLKDSCKELIMKMPKVLAPQKVINYLVKALKSKNLKARVECVDLIKHFVLTDQSMESVTDKNLNFIVSNIITKDNVLKAAILLLIEEAFKIMGGDCWKHMGKIDTAIVQEIIAKVPNSADQPELPTPKMSDTRVDVLEIENKSFTQSTEKVEPLADSSQLVEEKHEAYTPNEITPDKLSETKSPIVAINTENIPPKENQSSAKLSSTPLQTNAKTYDSTSMYVVHKENISNTGDSVVHPEVSFEKLIESIEKGNSNTLEELLVLNEIMYIKYDKNEQSIITNANRMVKVFISYFQRMTINESTVGDNRLNYLINTIHRFTTIKPVAQELNLEALSSLIELLLSKLIIEGLDKMGAKKEGDQIVKSINASVLRLLDNANSSLAFVSLIRMMGKYREIDGSSKMHNLVVKCLLKLSHVMNYIIFYVDMSKVFMEMHEFLIGHPTISPDDIDSKVMKTIVNEAVVLKKDKIWDDYSNVKEHRVQDVVIVKWIESRLKEIQPSGSSIDSELKEIIKSFKVHGIKSSIGKMYDYIHKNSTFDMNKAFSNCSRTFINHLNAELEEEKIKREKEAEATRAKAPAKIATVKPTNLQHTLGLLREKLSGPKKTNEALNFSMRTRVDKHDMQDSQERLKDLSDQIKKLKMGEWNNN